MSNILNIIPIEVISYAVSTVVLLIICGILYYCKKKEQAEKLLLEIVKDAEKDFGAGTGSLKYERVIDLFYPSLPIAVRLFITDTEIDKMIEFAVTAMKRELQADIDRQTPKQLS